MTRSSLQVSGLRPAMALLPLMLLLVCAGKAHSQFNVTVRTHYIAAVEIGWDYVHVDGVNTNSEQRNKNKDNPKKYIKAVYREYTDSTYSVPKPRQPWAGIQGPVIYAQANDRVVVHFKNLASQPYSISPVGVYYWKQSEGVGYDDSTTGQEKEDDAVAPGGYYVYVWEIHNEGPTTSDPECLTYSYSSQVDPVRDVNSGLIGALLICKTFNVLNEKGERKNPAFVLLFAVFDENKSWYGGVGERRSRERYQRNNSKNEYHTINGYVDSTLPGLTMCQGRNYVFWHLIGLGTAPRIHSIQFQDHALQVLNHRKVTLEMTSMSFITAEMKPATTGHFSISCQIHAHRSDGMKAKFTVEKCQAPPPGPDLRNVQHTDDEDYPDYFNVVDMRPPVEVRSRGSPFKDHYIAAEEIIWDYASSLSPSDSELQSRYLPSRPHHTGYRYKKVVYVEYTDASFTQKKNPVDTFPGPLLKARVNDQFRITFKNMASRPYNIYPNSLIHVYPMYGSISTSKKDLRSLGIQPNETFGYIWKLTREDGPLESDPACLTHVYQSTVSPEKDLASGLVGTLLICKYDAMDNGGRLLGPDEEWHLIFAVFDENRSWYSDGNILESAKNSSKMTATEFYDSNVIYSINGSMFSGRQFVMCTTDVTFWHVASVGTQSDFISVYFRGNLFLNQGLHHSVLTLFPMTGMTITMEMELAGEWEISAFDGSLRNRGMSIYYSVKHCDNREYPTVDEDEFEDISDFIDQFAPLPRSSKPRKLKMMTQLCEKVLGYHNATSRKESVANRGNQTLESDDMIPLDVLEELDEEQKIDSLNETKLEGRVRQRRESESNRTDGEHKENTILQIHGEDMGNSTAGESGRDTLSEDENKFEENNEIILEETKAPKTAIQEIDLGSVPPNHIQYNPEDQMDYLIGEDYNYTIVNNNATQRDLSLQYDDYSDETNMTSNGFGVGRIDLRSVRTKNPYYYIAAEEITWDYGIREARQTATLREMHRGMRKFLPDYKKVVFRAYKNKDFKEPVHRGEFQEHLGLMGPLIRVEINDRFFVVFKNKASRPFSFHLHGVYDHSQGDGINQNVASGVPGDPVPPGENRTYIWKVSEQQGPSAAEFDCKPGAYYSTVDKERDLHSGLIGPLLICKNGFLRTRLDTIQEFPLLFHSFDETKSWYFEENLQRHCVPPCHANTEEPLYHMSNTFAAINGYVAETLPGLLVAKDQLVRWHLINVGSDGEYHAVQFHGLPFTVHTKKAHRMGVFNLFPGVFGTVEMKPATVGTWLVECTVGDYQLAGMRAKLLVYDKECVVPLGMKSGRISDAQISASDHIGYWEPRLARLHQSGYINAWMGKDRTSWIQIDLLEPTLVHGVQTQGVRASLREYYTSHFWISYSLDQETWTSYRGHTDTEKKTLSGTMDSSTVKQNLFYPFVARFVRIHPDNVASVPALRLELLGCDLNSCSLPLGLQKLIPNDKIQVSSNYSNFLQHWGSNLARLHLEGSVNAWRPKTDNRHEWLQVNFGSVKRITGVVTQGAKSMMRHMMVTEFAVAVSDDGLSWRSALEPGSQREKIFTGNSDAVEEAYNVFEPPLFGQFIRIQPRGWNNHIALRLEVFGCDTQPSY